MSEAASFRLQDTSQSEKLEVEGLMLEVCKEFLCAPPLTAIALETADVYLRVSVVQTGSNTI